MASSTLTNPQQIKSTPAPKTELGRGTGRLINGSNGSGSGKVINSITTRKGK